MIYFIEHAGRIKVGYSSNIDKRIRSFRTAMPDLVLLGTMAGAKGHERTLHDALAQYRRGGEWFEDCQEVRSILSDARFNGVAEWKPARTGNYQPSMWDGRAKKLCEIICAGLSTAALPDIEREFDIPTGTLWGIRYRLSREVSVGEYFALIAAARETIKRRKVDLERAEAFVSDLEMEDAEATNQTIDVERALEAAHAAIHTHPKDPPG